MKIGIFGTGVVGNTIGKKLIEKGHEVMMGSRTADNEKAKAFADSNGSNAFSGTFAEAAQFGELLFNCTKGEVALIVLKLAGEKNMQGKTVIDVSNPLDFSNGFPPSLSICNTDSLGELLQRTFPSVKIVKTLNTVNCAIMVDAKTLPGPHDLFMCGNDDDAKKKVTKLLEEDFNWTNIIDLGDITNARATEMLLPVWVRLYGKFQHANFNFHINKK